MINMILSFLAKVVIGIALLVFLAKYIAWPLVKFIFCLLKWIIKTFPILILIVIFIPGVLDEGVYLAVLIILSIMDMVRGDSYSGSYSDHFVLNKKSKIAHRASDSSADTIAYKHREDVYATRSEIENMGYRIKND